MTKEVFLYHNSQEKTLIAESKKLKLKDKVLAVMQSACLLGTGVVSLILMAAAYYGEPGYTDPKSGIVSAKGDV